MKDRISLNPGRVKLTPVTGETDLFDMEMADNPTELGTALNKANLLTDATAAAIAAAFGSTPDTPNEALALLAGAANVEIIEYVGTGTYGAGNKCSVTFTHEPKFVIEVPSGAASVVSNYYGYTALLPWAKMKSCYEAYPTNCKFALMNNTNGYMNYTLSNDNKTLEWWYASASQAEQQLNASNQTYYFISWY